MNPYERIAKKCASSTQAASRVEEEKSMKGLKAVPATRTAARDAAIFDQDGDFNPGRFDYGMVKQALKPASGDRIFNSKGQINAQDKKDALTQIHHILNNVTKGNRHVAYTKAADGMTKEARNQILAAALSDPTDQGMKLIAQELALPIKEILDYEGFARKTFRIRKLAQAELFRLPRDIRSVAYIIGGDGMTPESRIHSKYVTPEEYKVTSFPTIDIADIYQLNFDVLDRAQDTAKQEIELWEDKAAVNLIDSASQAINDVVTFASLNISAFEAIRFQVERHRLIVENFMINRAELSDVITSMSTAVDPVTERELILAGYIGNVLGAQILTTAGLGSEVVIPAGTVYATTGADYLGEMGIRIELEATPFNKFPLGETVKGFAFFEMIGFCIPNAKACAKGTK